MEQQSHFKFEIIKSQAPAGPRGATEWNPAEMAVSQRILLIYRYPLLFQAIKALVESPGYAVYGASPQDAVATAQQLRPELILIDFEFPWNRGFEIAGELQRVAPLAKLILLTSHGEEFHVSEALQLGVKGYVLKTRTADDLLRAIEEVAQGRMYFSPEVAQYALQPGFGRQRRSDRLTTRERQVVTLIAEGNSTKEVAARLGISVKTADCHRTRIMDKLNVHQTASLVRYAIRQGLILP